uniref:Uncharacterized protein n=1 Tax=Romanomermis culicivorax TaxID=13658 RepID=A0A915LAX2_ROMCU
MTKNSTLSSKSFTQGFTGLFKGERRYWIGIVDYNRFETLPLFKNNIHLVKLEIWRQIVYLL